MESNPTVSIERKKRPYKKSRFGCRNCKLRKVKCDEIKPSCQRCRDYGVSCNFTTGTSDFQVSATASFLWQMIKRDDHQMTFKHSLPRELTMNLVSSDCRTSLEMDAQCMTRLERFGLTTMSAFGQDLQHIWQDRITKIAFKHPYLMHTVLALAAAHERYKSTAPSSEQTRIESHHCSQSITLFRKKLLHPFEVSDQDPLWAASALICLMAMASTTFDATPEESWPLRPTHPSDLDWFLMNGAEAIWHLTDPWSPGSIFKTMAQEYSEMYFELPDFGAERIPPELAELCNITALCSRDTNRYFVPAHVLARLQGLKDSETPGIRMMSFICQTNLSFKNLLLEKDPVALILLALWYERAGGVLWWVERRAQMETRAIRLYLERFHSGDVRIQRYHSQVTSGT